MQDTLQGFFFKQCLKEKFKIFQKENVPMP